MSAIPATVTPLPSSALLPDGHFLHKGYGKCIYTGPLEPAAIDDPADAAAAAESLHRDGYTVFRSALSQQEVAELRAYMDAQGGDDAKYDVPKWCFNKQIGINYNQRPELLHLTDKPRVYEAATAVLGDDCQVIGGSLWITGSGRQMGLHIDYQPLSLPPDVMADPRIQVPIFIASAHYYLDDMTLDLGPTTLVPGSHKAGRPPSNETEWNGRKPRALLVKAGDCMLFRSDIWHGAALNSSQQRRYLVQVHYGNVYIQRGTVPVSQPEQWNPKGLASLSERQRRLFGEVKDSQRGSYIAPKSLDFQRI